MSKKNLLVAAGMALVIGSVAANAGSMCNNFSKRSTFVYSSHHHGMVPAQFVGTYTYGKNASSKSFATFTVDAQGALKGEFTRSGKLLDWKGSVVAVGSDLAGDKKLLVHYIINRSEFGKMKKAVVRTLDTPGSLYITIAKGQSNTRMVDMIGHYENFIALNQTYQFKKA